ncbi:MAG: trypsin-like peptidase domain-containing protein, partial [Cyanobacteria bacterium P01_A01_bin.135]
MVRRYSLLALAGLAAAGAAIAPSYLAAQSNTARLSAIASQTTVQIIGQNSGSGVLIGKRGDTYCLLTAKHVVPSPDEYDIVTSDGDMHPLEFDKVVHIRDVDLAIAQFTSPKPYEVIEL